jgi:protein SCO1
MKQIIVIGVFVIAVAAGFIILNPFQETESAPLAEKKVKEEKASCCSSEKEAGEYSESSVYQLSSDWTDQDGNKVNLSDFQGKQVVMTMFFASCTYACPILVQDMKRIESEIPSSELKNYRFVLISIDPERDTPDKLKEFAQMKNLDTKRWTLLTGTEGDVMEFAAVTGFKYIKEDDGQFSHSNIINIINEDGEIIYQHAGLNQDIKPAANYLTKR